MSCSDAEKEAIREKLKELEKENKDKIKDLVENPEKFKKEIEIFEEKLDREIKESVKKIKVDTEEGIENFLQNIMNNPNNNNDKKKLEDSLKGLTYYFALKHTKNTKPNRTRTGDYKSATKSSANKSSREKVKETAKGGAYSETEESKKCKNFKNLDETNSTIFQRIKYELGSVAGTVGLGISMFCAISVSASFTGVGAPIIATCYCLVMPKLKQFLNRLGSRLTCNKHYQYSLIYDLKNQEKPDKTIIDNLINSGLTEEEANHKLIIDKLMLNSGLTEEEANDTLKKYNESPLIIEQIEKQKQEQEQRQQTVGGDSSSDSSIASSLLDEESLKEICDKLNTVVLPKLSKEAQEKIKAKLKAGPEEENLSLYQKFMKKTNELKTATKNVDKELNKAEKYLQKGGKKKRKTTKKGKKKTRKSKKIKKKTKKIKRKVRKTRKQSKK